MNILAQGDNLKLIQSSIQDNSIDLIYLDPPFNSKTDYSMSVGKKRIVAFKDTWQWNKASDKSLYTCQQKLPALGFLLEALVQSQKYSALSAYLVFMTERLVELKRVLKPHGSIYLHCDTSANSYLKMIMDTLWGADNFRSEIIWKRTSNHNDSKKWSNVHDSILFYAGRNFTWNPVHLPHNPEYVKNFYRFEDERGRYRLHEIIRTASMGKRPNLSYEYKGYIPEWGWRQIKSKVKALDKDERITWSSKGRPYLKRYLHEQKGPTCSNIWTDISPLMHSAHENSGYPTQKPITLLKRIILASSNEGDVVLDPFCGSATSATAAEELGRQWIMIDSSQYAIKSARSRLKSEFKDCKFKEKLNRINTKPLQGARNAANRKKVEMC